MRSALLALALALPCPAQELDAATRERILELTAGGTPHLAVFFNKFPFEHAVAFVRAAPCDDAARREAWGTLDGLIKGRDRDPGGVLMQTMLAMLPPDQWYFPALLKKELRVIHKQLGEGGFAWNAYEKFGRRLVGLKPVRTLCTERAEDLREAVSKRAGARPGGVWSSTEMNTTRTAEHTSVCYVYEGETRVEMMADAWKNELLPAETWWDVWDKDVADTLRGAGVRTFCDSRLVDLLRQKKAEEAAARLKELSEQKGAAAEKRVKGARFDSR